MFYSGEKKEKKKINSNKVEEAILHGGGIQIESLAICKISPGINEIKEKRTRNFVQMKH